MIYNFPIIETIDDVLPHIKGAEEFFVANKQGYDVINYTHTTATTFPVLAGPNDLTNSIRRECRGLVFYPDGRIMSRPYHKFFNMGEKSDNDQKHVMHEMAFHSNFLLQKEDGSMIRPIFSEEDPDLYHLGTKMGITETSVLAQAFHNKTMDGRHEFIMHCYDQGVTPIFEWCSRKSKIVLDYPEDRLILTAMRYNVTGEYFTYEIMERCASTYKLDLIKRVEMGPQFERFMEKLPDARDMEGYVLRFNMGHMVKIKCDWYLSLHKTKEAVRQEKDVLALILDDQVDDLLPLLSEEDKTKVLDFQTLVWKNVEACISTYSIMIGLSRNKNMTVKDFALEVADSFPVKSIAFNIFRGKMTAREAVLDYLRKQCSNKKSIENVRALLGQDVRYEEIVE